MTSKFAISSKEKLLACKKYFDQENEKWESKNMGNYRLVFSEKNSKKYEHYFYCNENALYRNNVQRPTSRRESWKEFQKKVHNISIEICLVNEKCWFKV